MYALQEILIFLAISLFPKITAEMNVSVANVTVLPIVNVFNTTERFWLYQKSSILPDNLNNCIFYKLINITASDYYAWIFESDSSAAISTTQLCHGKFKNGTICDFGTVEISCTRVKDDGIYSKRHDLMELMYIEPNCSVFFTIYLTGNRSRGVCDIFIKDSAVSRGPTENCKKHFNTTCQDYAAVYYSSERCIDDYIPQEWRK
ncbi:uncharacterized protein LOC142769175 [Rhipicephalus microplus]|uniref:uncharacterized protein LOC142769175 n=1 Tax=Rhipicephalus microplus TaxID=6941 RepID=UPI003F6D25E6